MDYIELLSRLGVASAHPGGFTATRKLLDNALPSGDLRILEVGCGTGKSACYLAGKGYRVTALDQHPLMLEKARMRAEREGISDIEWVEGSVHALPFADDTFDVVFAESVTVFTEAKRSAAEYYRVLKPGGRLLDRELALYAKMPGRIYKQIKDYFKLEKIYTVDEWLECFREAGFRCDEPRIEPFWSHEHTAEGSEVQELDISALLDPEIGAGVIQYAELMLAQERYFRACDFTALKAG